MIRYTTAPLVESGESFTSTKWNLLADAFNDRLKHGVGDASWRIWWKAASMFRRLFSNGPVDDWYYRWMNAPGINMDMNDVEPAHPFYLWMFGSGGLLAPESSRLNAIPRHVFGKTGEPVEALQAGAYYIVEGPGYINYDYAGYNYYDGDIFQALAGGLDFDAFDGAQVYAVIETAPRDTKEEWRLGKAQRGGYCPTTGYLNTPVETAAKAHWPIYAWAFIDAQELTHNVTAYNFMKTYGGYVGIDADELAPNYPTIRIAVRKFTNLRTGAVTEYRTTWSAANPDYITNVRYNPDHYALRRMDGTSWILPYCDYVEGPYTKTGDIVLEKQNGFQWNELLQRYMSSFRGADSQRPGNGEDTDWSVNDIAFDWERYLNTQHRLAPAYARMAGMELDLEYPVFAADGFHGELPAGTIILKRDDQANHYTVPEGHSIAGILLEGIDLGQTVKVELRKADGSEDVLAELTINNGTSIRWLEAIEGDVKFVLVSSLPADGTVRMECAVLQKQYPDLTHAYVYLRRSTTIGDAADPEDTRGYDYASAKQLSDTYFQKGCILNPDDVLLEAISVETPPIYECARRLVQEHLRLIKRDVFTSYGLTPEGDSVLTFQRYLNMGGQQVDLFAGIAPPDHAIESGQLMPGVTYEVRGNGTVSYGGGSYVAGQQFVGQPRNYDYTTDGAARPWQLEGIISIAPQRGWANEWQMFLGTNAYGGSSLEMDQYGDPLAFLHNRCHTFNSQLGWPGNWVDLAYHIGYADELHPNTPAVAEAPSGYNYIKGLNAEAPDDFYRSCPIYPKDYELKSVTCPNARTVRIVLRGRLRQAAVIERSDENAVTDYLTWRGGGAHCPNRTGDYAMNHTDQATHGSCCPRFYFTRRIRKVYEDENDILDDTDTSMHAEELQWLSFILEPMCEGYLDEEGNTLGVYCGRKPYYTFPTLCRQVLGKHWLYLMPPDGRQGFGPTPNMRLYKDHFNNLAKLINKLVLAPLDLPWSRQWEYRNRYEWHRRGFVEADDMQDNFANNAALNKCRLLTYGDPIPTYRNAERTTIFEPPGGILDPLQYPPTAQETFAIPLEQVQVLLVYDTDWEAAWHAFLPHSPIAHESLSGPIGGFGLWPDGTQHYTGSEVVVVNDSGFYYLNSLLFGRRRLQIRMGQALPKHLLDPEILELIQTGGRLSVLINDTEGWHVDGGGESPSCVATYGEHLFWDPNFDSRPGGFKPTAYSAQTQRCIGLPIDESFLDGAPVEIRARPIQPSEVYLMGNSEGVCPYGPSSMASVAGFAGFYVKVPLI